MSTVEQELHAGCELSFVSEIKLYELFYRLFRLCRREQMGRGRLF